MTIPLQKGIRFAPVAVENQQCASVQKYPWNTWEKILQIKFKY
jgi:hypothetical protein